MTFLAPGPATRWLLSVGPTLERFAREDKEKTMSAYGSGSGPEYLDDPRERWSGRSSRPLTMPNPYEPRVGRGSVECWSCHERAVPPEHADVEDVTCRMCGADPCCRECGERLDPMGACLGCQAERDALLDSQEREG